ncbi:MULTISPECIES: hypothetical protein [Fusobacterium]|uniref:Uncharacterized protein n=1 Tax=Fusobacterium varium ATCC 27725 TaxID=469618 RepID=A0ABM6U3D2_FUSVA|nr:MULTISPECIES: hypothetical protein [Fusobacterium]AVQ30828.1 hypothetical protein C4N18_06230 [Fusobacterium varium ATCC 27725]MCF2672168.1 hypothetical protein [Fusobacterium varium]MDY3058953.1 hypothetical protein [Fusobacterium sp.]RHG35309.1 hypothetical protein DW261_08225 [Fusobacterium varium]HBJ79362.1 hypothetical protein [Fusobacterium sp.]
MKINHEENLMGTISLVIGILLLVASGLSVGLLKICLINSGNGWFVILGHIMVLVMIAIALIGPAVAVVGLIFGGIGIFGSFNKKRLAFIGLVINLLSLSVCILIFKEMGIKL